MDVGTAGSVEADGEVAVTEAFESLTGELAGPPDLLVLYASAEYDAEIVSGTLESLAKGAAIHGGTSCQGALTHRGLHEEGGKGLGLFGLHDPKGDYGVGSARLGDEPAVAAQDAITEAIENVGRPGEVPRLVWMTGTPGCEEAVLEGIEAVIGARVPVIGGSAADNEVSGEWHQIAGGQVYSDAVVLTAMYPGTRVGFSFHSGYEPTEKRGTVTRADGRVLYDIDGEPAAERYNEWTEGAVDDEIETGGNVLQKTTLHPLGRRAGRIEESSHYYKLSHPEAVGEDGSLSLFTEIEEGDEIVCMTGTVDSLTTRAGRVANAACETAFLGDEEIAGALVVYCAGCMLAVEDRIDEVTESLNDALGGEPFLGTFTFGEQGCFVDGDNLHANLMISVVIFCE